MEFIAIELGAIIGLLAVISWDIGRIKNHLKGEELVKVHHYQSLFFVDTVLIEN